MKKGFGYKNLLTDEMITDMRPPLVKGLPSLDFDGFISYIKNGYAKNVVFLTGAGASVAAGIPDFRSPKTGVYSNLEKYKLPFPEAVFTIDYFDQNPAPFFEVSKLFLVGHFKPVAPHFLTSLFYKHGMLLRVYTQNVDGLDIKAGVPKDFVVECHGSNATNTCRKCGNHATYEEYEEEFKKGQIVYCKKCGTGVVKPDTVFFGEDLPERFYDLNKADFKSADLLIVIGTSLKVDPCSELPGKCRLDCPRIMINKKAVATFREKLAIDEDNHVLIDLEEKNKKEKFKFGHITNRRDIFLGGDCEATCERIIEALGWKEEYLAMKEQWK